MVQSHIDGDLGKGIVWGGGVSGIPKNRLLLNNDTNSTKYQWHSQGWICVIWYSLVGLHDIDGYTALTKA